MVLITSDLKVCNQMCKSEWRKYFISCTYFFYRSIRLFAVNIDMPQPDYRLWFDRSKLSRLVAAVHADVTSP
jgi:hypothetical protein